MSIYSQEKSARTAYEVYSNTTIRDLNHANISMPTWEALLMPERDAWMRGISAALEEYEAFRIEAEKRDREQDDAQDKKTLV